MLYVVLIPTLVWLVLLLLLWGALAHQTVSRLKLKGRLLTGWLLVLALQAIAASTTVIATRLDPIDRFSCLTGVYGWWVALGLAASGIVVIAVLLKQWPRDRGGKRVGLVSTLGLWGSFSAVAVLAHLRSALLCTV